MPTQQMPWSKIKKIKKRKKSGFGDKNKNILKNRRNKPRSLATILPIPQKKKNVILVKFPILIAIKRNTMSALILNSQKTSIGLSNLHIGN